jgi:hypothetical protein
MQQLRLSRWICAVALLALYGCGSAQNSGSTGNAGSSASSANAAEQAAVPAPLPPIVINPGTTITVTVDQLVSSKDGNVGDRVEASLAAPVVVDGKEVIRPGAKVSGTVTVAKSAGRFNGNAELGITLSSVAVGGHSYTIHTSTFDEASKGRGKRTAIGAGVGAGAGALIGALAGGGKGAAIGAGAGGGAGVAGAALTGNRDITIEPETKLDFKLARALEIQQK